MGRGLLGSPPASVGRHGRGKGVEFMRDTGRSLMKLVRESRPTTACKLSGKRAEREVVKTSNVENKKAKKINDDSLLQRGPVTGGSQVPNIMPLYSGHVAATYSAKRGKFYKVFLVCHCMMY